MAQVAASLSCLRALVPAKALLVARRWGCEGACAREPQRLRACEGAGGCEPELLASLSACEGAGVCEF